MSVKLFVYGTLCMGRTGIRREDDPEYGMDWAGAWLDEYVATRVPATTRGYIDRTSFYFPCAVFSDKGGVIQGELLTIPESTATEVLEELDRYEGVAHGLFRRVTIPVDVQDVPHMAGIYEAIAYEYARSTPMPRGLAEGRSDSATHEERRMDIQGVVAKSGTGPRASRASRAKATPIQPPDTLDSGGCNTGDTPCGVNQGTTGTTHATPRRDIPTGGCRAEAVPQHTPVQRRISDELGSECNTTGANNAK